MPKTLITSISAASVVMHCPAIIWSDEKRKMKILLRTEKYHNEIRLTIKIRNKYLKCGISLSLLRPTSIDDNTISCLMSSYR